MKILFVCTANKFRSKTAEVFYKEYRPWHEYQSCGINKYLSSKAGGQYISRKLLDWADLIVCMDKCHSDFIRQRLGSMYDNKMKVLALEDIYGYMDEALIVQLKQQINFL